MGALLPRLPDHKPLAIIDARDFLPTPTQDAFLWDHKTRIKALIGGLGSGKTRTGAEAFVDLILANPGHQFLMAGPSHEMTFDLCVPAFLAALPPEMIVGHDKKHNAFILRGRRRVKYASADKPSTLEGRNLAGFWADEARYWKKQSWLNLIARIRHKEAIRLQGIVTTTPAQGWLADEFDAGKSNRSVYRVSTRENAHNLDPGYIADLESSYSPRLAKSLIDGLFTIIEGQVYEEYDAARHLVPWDIRPPLRTVLMWDFGARRSAVLVAQITREPVTLLDGRTIPAKSCVVTQQILLDDSSTERSIPVVMARLGRVLVDGRWLGGQRVDAVYCDPAGAARGQAVDVPSVALLREAFGECVRFFTDVGATWIPNGIARVQGALSPVDGSPPRLYFARELADPTGVIEKRRGVVKALGSYRYPERTTAGGRGGDDHPVKDGETDHVLDALRYGITGVSRDDWAERATGTGIHLIRGG